MSNLHRSLAPISSAAWAQIDDEGARTFRTRIAGRRMVDVPEPGGTELSAVGLGHIAPIDSPADGVDAQQRQVLALVELRAPFTVTRAAVDDVDRGAQDSDWQPVKHAAEALATAEDQLVFTGSQASGITGIIPSTSNAVIELPQAAGDLPNSVSKALTTLRMVGVQGPYRLALSTELYTAVNESDVDGYPVLKHLERLLGEENIVLAPSLDGAVLVTLRGGDYILTIGQDVSIGYLSHDAESITLYLQESLTFQAPTAEASVVLK